MKTTEENNRMIALFTGDIKSLNDKVSFAKNCTPSEFKYHTSWDWLMPVVEKITTLEEFHEWKFNSSFWDVFCQLDMSEIYDQAVVKFIEWYNEQQKP